jgi:hypothetical protein
VGGERGEAAVTDAPPERRDLRARSARDRLAGVLELHPRDLRVISADEAEAMEKSILLERQRRN